MQPRGLVPTLLCTEKWYISSNLRATEEALDRSRANRSGQEGWVRSTFKKQKAARCDGETINKEAAVWSGRSPLHQKRERCPPSREKQEPSTAIAPRAIFFVGTTDKSRLINVDMFFTCKYYILNTDILHESVPCVVCILAGTSANRAVLMQHTRQEKQLKHSTKLRNARGGRLQTIPHTGRLLTLSRLLNGVCFSTHKIDLDDLDFQNPRSECAKKKDNTHDCYTAVFPISQKRPGRPRFQNPRSE